MPVDPNDLLIFRKRNLGASGELPGPMSSKNLLAAPKAGYPIPPEMQQAQTFLPPKADDEELISSSKLIESGEYVQALPGKFKVANSAREDIRAAWGLTCINHQWRKAYAICHYCKRPFCYADLTVHERNFYCLEDIDHISGGEIRIRYSINAITIIGAVALLVNAWLLVYLAYPSMLTFVNSISVNLAAQNIPALSLSTILGAVGSVLGAVESTFSTYPFPSLYFTIASLNFIACFAAAFSSRSGFYFALFVSLFTLLGAIYAFLNTGIDYTLYTATIAFMTIGILAYSRMSSVTYAADEEISASAIDWPRPEVF